MITYEEGIEKLTRAEDTSNIEDSISSSELREREKRKRHLKAKRVLSEEDFNSSSEENLVFSEDKENNI